MKRIAAEVSKYVVGMRDVINLMLVAVLTEGHILLEGPPGTGKTLLAKTFAAAIGGSFKRIQMTPDLLPADILGTVYYDLSTGRLRKLRPRYWRRCRRCRSASKDQL